MRAGSKVVVLVFGVFGGPSSGGTAVPGLEPTMPALVVGEVDQFGVQQHAIQCSRRNKTVKQWKGAENPSQVKRSGKSRARLGI